LHCFGDCIATREKYKHYDGIEAVSFYVVQKYHWLPSQVRSMNWEDLKFLLAEEMHGWNIPKEAMLSKKS